MVEVRLTVRLLLICLGSARGVEKYIPNIEWKRMEKVVCCQALLAYFTYFKPTNILHSSFIAMHRRVFLFIILLCYSCHGRQMYVRQCNSANRKQASTYYGILTCLVLGCTQMKQNALLHIRLPAVTCWC